MYATSIGCRQVYCLGCSAYLSLELPVFPYLFVHKRLVVIQYASVNERSCILVVEAIAPASVSMSVYRANT